MCQRSQTLRSHQRLSSSSSRRKGMIWTSTRRSKWSDTSPDHCYYVSRSTKIKCPYCDAVSNSIVEYQPSLLGYIITMISMLIFGFLSLILMPFLVSLTKTAIHRCAKCLNQVQDNTYFGFSSLDDKLFQYECGKVGIIMTRRTIMYILMVLVGCLSIYVFILVEESHIHNRKSSIISCLKFFHFS